MICGLQQYWCRVEDKMWGSEEDETILEKSVTRKSSVDYVCFDVYDGIRLAVVLLEIKVQCAVKVHSIAQVIGYFIRSVSSAAKPAVCCVLSEEMLNVVFSHLLILVQMNC